MSYDLQRYEPQTLEARPLSGQHDLVQVDDVMQFVRTIWRRKGLVLLCLATALGLGTLYFLFRSPIYRSTAQVLVVQKRPQEFPGMDPHASYVQDDMSTHMTVIKSPWFAEGVLQKLSPDKMRTFADQPSPRAVITSALDVTLEPDPNPNSGAAKDSSSIFNLQFVGPDPRESQAILEAVLQHYQQFLGDTSRTINEDALRQVTEKAEDVHKRLREKELEYQEFRKKSPLLWNPKDGAGSYQGQLSQIEAARSALDVRRGETQQRLDEIRKAFAEKQPRERVLAMIPETSKWRSYLTLEEKLYPLLAQEKSLLQSYGPGHPDVKAIRDQIRFTRDYYAPASESRKDLLAEIGKQHEVHLEDPIDTYVHGLEQDLQQINASQQALAQQFDKERLEATEVANYELRDAQFVAEIGRTSQYYDTLVKQIQGVNIGKDLAGYSMRAIAPPDYGLKASPLAKLVFPVAGFLGLLGGVGLALFAETAHQGFRTPEEVRRRLGLPVVGCIPSLNGHPAVPRQVGRDAAALDPILCTQCRPNSVEAEAYRGVRTAIYFSTQGRQHKVIQITSPTVGDGKTVLAANLAVSIAQSGRKTLLIDADLHRPRLHQIFACSARVGLASVIAGETEFHAAVQPTDLPGLSLLPCGPLPSNPADLLTSPQLQQLLEQAGQEYDFVLVDTPAILAVTDPRIVAPLVDGVLLTFRMTNKNRPDVERAKEILADLHANLLGAVVNAADCFVEFSRYDDQRPEQPAVSPVLGPLQN
jgi:capsular exopolysaccharide synthesis family protein